MPRKKPPDLTDAVQRQRRIDDLRADLEKANLECDRALAAQQPFADQFWRAHGFLASLPTRPSSTKRERLDAYDARLRAGHAWHPYRQRYRDATRWVDAILKEMKTP